MGIRYLFVLIGLGMSVGLVFGVLAGASVDRPGAPLSPNRVELSVAEQDDYVIMIAEAYAGDHDLRLAEDRLSRLDDKFVFRRVEDLAKAYLPQRDLVAYNLATLAIALGSRNPQLIALSTVGYAMSVAMLLPTPVPPILLPTETPAPTYTSTLLALNNMRLTPTRTATRRPATRVPTRTPTPTPTLTATPTYPPPPQTEWYPEYSRWPSNIVPYYAEVPPGQGYWHLKKAIYCDAFDKSDPHRKDFQCDQLPGGGDGVTIYVMTGGADIHAYTADGKDVGGDPRRVGEKKSKKDMCNCTYAMGVADYRISVVGAPSDSLGGFCMCSVNFGWSQRAHVRYFLYFEYITR